jgi:cytidylate kinase
LDRIHGYTEREDITMSIILISADNPWDGQEIARKTAGFLGYDFLGREILAELAQKRRIPESKLAESIDNYPKLFSINAKARCRYLAYIQEATLGRLLKDNIVCQGIAAHLYVSGVSHAMKVRLISPIEKRAEQLASQNQIPLSKAIKVLARQKKYRQQWTQDVFRFDETDPGRYDLMINLGQIDPDETAKIISESIVSRKFKPMTYSIRCLQDLELASRVKVLLADNFPGARVRADGGTLVVEITGLKREKRKKETAIKERLQNIPGVEYVEVHFINDFFKQAADSYR